MSIFSLFIKETNEDEVVNTGEQSVPHKKPGQPEQIVDWYSDEYEGRLSVDVYQRGDKLVIKSTIAGVRGEDLDITLNNDVITIRGRRSLEDKVETDDYYYQECYWGGFSRSIVLPVEVKPDQAEASLKNGVLTIVLPKAKTESVNIQVAEQE